MAEQYAETTEQWAERMRGRWAEIEADRAKAERIKAALFADLQRLQHEIAVTNQQYERVTALMESVR